MTPLIAAALNAAMHALSPQPQEAPVIARQVRIPVDQVLGAKIKPTDEERDALKEQRRHNRKVEKELRRLVRDDRFAFPKGATAQPARVRTLPPSASRY